MGLEPGRHEPEHVLGDLVRRKAFGVRHRKPGLRGLPVLLVEVPLPAGRLVPLHEESRLAAHVAIEVFHAQLLAAVRPRLEFLSRGDEAVIVRDLDGASQSRRPAAHHLQDAPLVRCGDGHAGRLVQRNGAGDFAREASRRAGLVQAAIIYSPALGAKLVGEVAHAREHQRDLLLVVQDVGCFFHHLAHQNDVAGFVGLTERGQSRRELIPEHHDELSCHAIPVFTACFGGSGPSSTGRCPSRAPTSCAM